MSSVPANAGQCATFIITDAQPASNDAGQAALVLTTTEAGRLAFCLDRQTIACVRAALAAMEAFLTNDSQRPVITAAIRVHTRRRVDNESQPRRQ
jgi:hypothetical protein